MNGPDALLDDLLDRIHGLMDVLPPIDWTVSEAEQVVDVMAGLVAARAAAREFGS